MSNYKTPLTLTVEAQIMFVIVFFSVVVGYGYSIHYIHCSVWNKTRMIYHV